MPRRPKGYAAFMPQNKLSDVVACPAKVYKVGQRMYYVYLLKLNNNDFYAGSTAHLENRLLEHKKGKNKSTKLLRPVELVWSGSFKTRELAEGFEKYLKSSSGFAFRNKRLI